MERLLEAKKLSLVIDLDQTILHATMDPSVAEWQVDDLHTIWLDSEQGAQQQAYFIKFRPGLRDFLWKAAKLFELHVYTMGSRQYARACTGLLDPNLVLFYDRIMSRDDAGVLSCWNKKSLKRIFPHSSRMVLVLDDRGDVWEWCGNLTPIRPFLFFAARDDRDGGKDAVVDQQGILRGQVGNIVAGAECDEELQKVWNRLQFIHSQFFADSPYQDVTLIVDEMRRSVLKDTRLCFSGVFPVSESNADIVKMAVSFGAQVLDRVSEDVTALICGRPGSDKHLIATSLNIPVVSVDWLWECCWSWNQVDLEDFLLLPPPSSTSLSSEDSVEFEEERVVKRQRPDNDDLLDWLDNDFESISSDDIYGRSPQQSLSNQ